MYYCPFDHGKACFGQRTVAHFIANMTSSIMRSDELSNPRLPLDRAWVQGHDSSAGSKGSANEVQHFLAFTIGQVVEKPHEQYPVKRVHPLDMRGSERLTVKRTAPGILASGVVNVPTLRIEPVILYRR